MDHIINALQELNFEVESKNSDYYNSNGILVPRVTEILSKMIHSDALMYWANSLGLKGQRYRETLNKAANLGTVSHHAIEMFLKEKLEDNSNIPFLGFLLWYETITKKIGLFIEPILVEHRMTCQWFGGTLDALMKIGEDIYLVDFKTSNVVTYKYFLQLAAYRFMLKQEKFNVDGVLVLQLNKNEPGFNEYLLNFKFPDHLDFIDRCEHTFMSLVYAFYNIDFLEKQYKNVIQKGGENDLIVN